ncbi:spondin-2 [Uranotaenia lowii]|uniref:spondin-2 n=1 Tax=Uranotaenia lowii TaxID=190385 RepID=UPI002479ADBE|nr:spondin-2 [Uranotaenia lowii]XP_055596211.1 spondin-2 [Uranotaenia lowii]XP_055596212.1 spondin-2 [Uranotaenia lowii]XP_055596213.1 spondin-2 [Uranotaenia lowii]
MQRVMESFLVILMMIGAYLVDAAIIRGESCDAEALVFYRIRLVTNWNRKLFPKHYPEFRPPPQWSITYGQSHNASFRLFRLKDYASQAVQNFAETGHAHALEEHLAEQQSNGMIHDEFHLPKIPKGQGATEGTFFVDGQHTKVSFMTKIVPSPDWFVGVDSYNLCLAGRWVDNITIPLGPLDAGTSNGLTFTSPKWPTNPPNVIEQITARYPMHLASSFFYPEIKHLPSIAHVTFTKLHEYRGSNNVHKKVKKLKTKQRAKLLKKLAYANRKSENEVEKVSFRSSNGDCMVSGWSEWSPCSKSCDVGKKTRSRSVLRYPTENGRDCPHLTETQWCGSARQCTTNESYFRW